VSFFDNPDTTCTQTMTEITAVKEHQAVVSGLGSGEAEQGEFAREKATLSVECPHAPGKNEPLAVNYFTNRISPNYFAPKYYNITTLRIASLPGTLLILHSGNQAVISGRAQITYEDLMSILAQSQGTFSLTVIDDTPDFFQITSLADNEDPRLACNSGMVKVTSGDLVISPCS
jgi:hypothetical protein